MANVKISELPSATAVAATDVSPIVVGGVTQKATNTQIVTSALNATPVTLAQGGTGATTAAAARTALGLGSIATINSPVPLANGGTGSTTAAAALTAILPAQSGNAGKVLTTTGTAAVWSYPTAAPVAVSALPASPTLGMMASVNDGADALAWGDVVTGGGSVEYLVWFNGTAWTVVGK